MGFTIMLLQTMFFYQNENGTHVPIRFLKFKLYLVYNDYETSYTTYINHARWHWCLRWTIFVWEATGVPWGNPPVWLGDHMTMNMPMSGIDT